jgi:hypothetical protein
MRKRNRIISYVLITAIVETVLVLGLFSYGESDRLTVWLIPAENLGAVLFRPYRGTSLSGLLALGTGAVWWFLMVTAIDRSIAGDSY